MQHLSARRPIEAGGMASRKIVRPVLAIAFAVAASGACAQTRADLTVTPLRYEPVTFRMEGLANARERIKAGDRNLLPAYRKLLKDADAAMSSPIVAVTDKRALLPPSGDKHDYFSLSPYWWPDPSKPDGLPYIRRDGETNPESKRDLDQPRIAAMGANVRDLALAYFFSGKRDYASRAAQQLRAWFLDSATRMTPHLRYSQLVRGNDKERGSGIIDSRWFIDAIDAASLLRESGSWSASDEAALRAWFKSYLDWLLTSDNGKHEQAAKNNHGSWFAAQTAAYSLFVGDTARVREIADSAKARIGWQINPDGQQPIELERTRSMHYSGFNVEALSRVAEAGRSVGVDLWHYRAPNGGSLIAAIDNLSKYLGTNEKWPGQQIDAVGLDLLLIHLRRADYVLGTSRYEPVLRRLPANEVSRDLSALLYPDSGGR